MPPFSPISREARSEHRAHDHRDHQLALEETCHLARKDVDEVQRVLLAVSLNTARKLSIWVRRCPPETSAKIQEQRHEAESRQYAGIRLDRHARTLHVGHDILD
jgi:hypothetical protein